MEIFELHHYLNKKLKLIEKRDDSVKRIIHAMNLIIELAFINQQQGSGDVEGNSD